MTPDTHPSLSGDLSDTASLLHALAAASDWQTFCETLRRALPRLLPATRLDIYALGSDDAARLRFTSIETDASPPALSAGADLSMRTWFERHGYRAIMTMPLIGVGRQAGWLVFARKQGALAPATLALAEHLAPLIAVWLCYDQTHAELVSSESRVGALEQRLRATDALRLRAMLAAGAAHDIGNLFTSVLGYAQILQQDVPAPMQPDAGMIVRAAEDGRQLLRRLQSDNPALDPCVSEALTLPNVIRDTIRLTRPLWERRVGISVETALEETPAVRVPAADLREVLVNLILNAVAAMVEGGVITIRCGATGDHVNIAVSDTGQGIAREYQNAIFQPFVTSRAEGSGLGLSISRAIVEGYGGTLTVESAPNQGATFTIALPAVRG